MSAIKQEVSKFAAIHLWPGLMFLVAVIFYWYEFLLRVSPSPIFDSLMQEFAIGNSGLGDLYSDYFISYALLQLPAGMLADKFGPRRLLTFAILLCALSTVLFSVTHSYELIRVSRFFIGAGSAFAFVCCMKIVTIWFRSDKFAVLSGATLMVGSLGGFVGLKVLSVWLNYIEWRELMFNLGVAGIVLAILAFIFIRDNKDEAKFNLGAPVSNNDAANKVDLIEGVTHVTCNLQIVLAALYGFFMTAPTDSIAMWGEPFLVSSQGVSKVLAGEISSMLFVGLAIGSLLMGWLSEKLGSRKLVMFIGVIGALISSYILIYVETDLNVDHFLFFNLGLFGAYIMCFVVIKDIVQDKYIATAVGFVNTMSMVGSFLLSKFMGHITDWADGIDKVSVTVVDEIFYSLEAYRYSFSLVVIFYILTIVLLFFMQESYGSVAKNSRK